MDAVKALMGRLAVAIGDAGEKRVAWERSRDSASEDVFLRAKAHRDAERAATDLTLEAIDAYAKHVRDGVTQGGTAPTG